MIMLSIVIGTLLIILLLSLFVVKIAKRLTGKMSNKKKKMVVIQSYCYSHYLFHWSIGSFNAHIVC